jgi:hypothetical protein
MMADDYAIYLRGPQSPAERHFAIVPANGVDLPNRPRVLKVLSDGAVALRDSAGVVITYPVVAGEVLLFSAVGVEATGTTATLAGWL